MIPLLGLAAGPSHGGDASRPYNPRTLLTYLTRRIGPSGRAERRPRPAATNPPLEMARTSSKAPASCLLSSSLAARQGVAELRQDGRIFTNLLMQVLIGAVSAFALLVGVEALAGWLSRFFHPGSLLAPVGGTLTQRWWARPSPHSPHSSRSSSPPSVLSRRRRTAPRSRWHSRTVCQGAHVDDLVRVVVLALVFGTALLAFPVVSARDFRGLTVVAFAAQASSRFSVSLSSAAACSISLIRRRCCNVCIRNSSGPFALHRQHVGTFQMKLSKRTPTARSAVACSICRVGDAHLHPRCARWTWPARPIYQLLACWNTSSTLKSFIPTKSTWFARTGSHPDWLTISTQPVEHGARNTNRRRAPLSPDPLWVKRAILHTHHTTSAVSHR